MTIQVMKIYQESFKHVREHTLEWLRVAYAPIVIFFIGLFLAMILYGTAGFQAQEVIFGHTKVMGESVGAGFLVLIGNLIYFITHLIASYGLNINGFRYGALNEGGNQWWTLPLNMRLVKMILFTLLLGLLMGLYGMIAAGIIIGAHFLVNSIALNVILGILIGLYGIYLLVRIGLMFLLIALDKPEPIRTSWHLLKGNVLRFIGLMLLIGISILAITGIGMGVLGLLWMLFATFSSVLAIIFGLLMILFGAFIWFINWAVVSVATARVYQALS